MRYIVSALAIASCLFVLAGPSFGDDSAASLAVDHFVRLKSTAPSMTGQVAQIYVRERVQAGVALRGVPSDRVALFIHGAGTPAEVSFDVPYQDYSWMGYLAQAGFDVFAMDTTGYGRSSRPSAMSDPCNLTKESQPQFMPSLISAPCAPSFPSQATTVASDWDEVGAVVDYVRALRHVDKVSLLGWSLGGIRAGGYAVLHPEKISRMVLLAPAYNRTAPSTQPATTDAAAFNTQSHAEFLANWDRQVGCADQYDPAVADAIWTDMLQSDPVGATWGTGVRRAPNTASWGWNQAAVAKTQIPTLMVSGPYDKQVPTINVQNLLTDLAAPKKVFVDLACSSHAAMWEKNHRLLFRASLEWLTSESVNGTKQGTVRLGY